MTESMPPTPEQFWQLNRDLMEKALDKAENDPAWKQRLLDDPEAAMQEAGFPEAERLWEIQASVEAGEAEVTGQRQFGGRPFVTPNIFSDYCPDTPSIQCPDHG